jgi:hypothetical protein
MGVDTRDDPPSRSYGVAKVLSIRTHVFTAKEDMFKIYLTMSAGSGYLLYQVFDPFGGVLNGKRFPENMPIPIIQHVNMVFKARSIL